MLEPCQLQRGAELTSEKNIPRYARALDHEAFHVQAQADRIELEAGSDLSLQQKREVARLRSLAGSLYSKSSDLHAQHEEQKTKFQKMKPRLMNGIIATVVAAEILSIPILLANIYMMCDKPHKHAATAT